MSGSNKNKVDKEKEKAEWQFVLDLQEKKLFEGMKEICDKMGEGLKSCLHKEMVEIRNEIGELKKGLQDVTSRIYKIETKNLESESDIWHLKDQNKMLQHSNFLGVQSLRQLPTTEGHC